MTKSDTKLEYNKKLYYISIKTFNIIHYLNTEPIFHCSEVKKVKAIKSDKF